MSGKLVTRGEVERAPRRQERKGRRGADRKGRHADLALMDDYLRAAALDLPANQASKELREDSEGAPRMRWTPPGLRLA